LEEADLHRSLRAGGCGHLLGGSAATLL